MKTNGMNEALTLLIVLKNQDMGLGVAAEFNKVDLKTNKNC